MKEEKILKKAIEKVNIEEYNLLLMVSGEECLVASLSYYYIIFSHEFARAFFGEKVLCDFAEGLTEWQYHLQTMVLEKKPLDYLEQFLK